MRLKAGVVVAVLWATGVMAMPIRLSAQKTPGERADSLYAIATSPETPDVERPLLWTLILATWNEEGARALLAGDVDRLAYAAEREAEAVPIAYFWMGSMCRDIGVAQTGSSIASHLSYVVGHWNARERVPPDAAQLANGLFTMADRYRKIGVLLRQQCPSSPTEGNV